MKYKKRSVIVGLALLIIGAVISAACFTGKRDVDWQAICKENLDKNQDALLLLMAEYQGQFVDKESEAFGSFASLFDGGLTCADLRDPTKAFFSFSVLHPETSKRLLYCPDNRLPITADLFLEADAEEGAAFRPLAPAVQWCREEPAQGREVRAAPGPLAAVDGSRGGGRGIFFSPPLNSQRLELMGRVGALSRPEPPVVCPECTLGRGGAALPAGLSSGAPGSPVHPTTQSAVGARTLQGGPHPATHPHTHGSTAPSPLGRTK